VKREKNHEKEEILGLLKICFQECPGMAVTFVIDGDSFPCIGEDIFCICSTVKDGFARVNHDQDKLPVQEPTDAM
jgi:hypothetical protein